MKKLALGAMALALIVPALAHAEPTDAQKAEWAQKRAEHMSKIDVDKDGNISKQEFLNDHAARAEEMFGRLDTNHDGKLTSDEMKNGREAMREQMRQRMGGMMAHPPVGAKITPTAPAK